VARILVPLPLTDFDPTEVAVSWAALSEAGHSLIFATESGTRAAADARTLGRGEGPLPPPSLWAHADNIVLYDHLVDSAAFATPIRWADAAMADFDAILFPGGHGPGMRPYCDSADVRRLAGEAFAAGQLIAAICHGVLPLARTRRADGQPLLDGRRTTSLTGFMERLSIWMTRRRLGDHYRTYPETVEAETRRAIGSAGAYLRGPLLPHYATRERPDLGFIVEDGDYISARWPGDAWTLARRMVERLS